jgi:hypothetical protein
MAKIDELVQQTLGIQAYLILSLQAQLDAANEKISQLEAEKEKVKE